MSLPKPKTVCGKVSEGLQVAHQFSVKVHYAELVVVSQQVAVLAEIVLQFICELCYWRVSSC